MNHIRSFKIYIHGTKNLSPSTFINIPSNYFSNIYMHDALRKS